MSSEINPRDDSIDSTQTGGITDLDLAPPTTEQLNDKKTNSEESIDSNFLIEAVHYKNEGKIVVPDPKQQRSTEEQGVWRGF